jgi:hypothetical protein
VLFLAKKERYMAQKYQPTSLAFPHWQREYEALLAETDEKLLFERATDLEDALFIRVQELSRDFYATAEREAMENAIKALRNVQEEKLGFPKWENGPVSEKQINSSHPVGGSEYRR